MLCNLRTQLTELLVARSKVCLTVDLDNRTNLCICREVRRYSTLGSNATSLLLRLRNALLAQIINCLLHIAVRLCERLLAVHHTSARTLTQFLYHCSSDCHYISSQTLHKKGQGITLPYPC